MSRIKPIYVIVHIVFLLLLLTLVRYQLLEGARLRQLSYRNSLRVLKEDGSRGRILDRNGLLIATNKFSYDLIVYDTSDWSESDIQRVAGILEISSQDLKKKIGETKSLLTPKIIARNLNKRQAILLEELKPLLGGMMVHSSSQRYYPYDYVSHLVGYVKDVDRDILRRYGEYGYAATSQIGVGGIEELYDLYLRQEAGGLLMEVDYRGRFVRTIGWRPGKDGQDITLTIDLRLQRIAQEALGKNKGAVVILDPNSGEILALVSAPLFSSQAFVESQPKQIRKFFTDKDAPMLNRAIAGLYPLGSVFKLIVASAALESGRININTHFLCKGKMEIAGMDFSCLGNHGAQNVIEAIMHSCNIFFYNTGLLIGPQFIHDYALKLGLGRLTGIDLPGEKKGFVPSPLWRRVTKLRGWFSGDTANLSIGQGELLVTPIQVARMLAVFANGGRLVTPHLVKQSGARQEEKLLDNSPSLFLKQSTLNIIREGLRRVVADPTGTAHNLDKLSVDVVGKTGTAQVSNSPAHGWFAGFFPFKKPRYVICVFVEHGHAGYYASRVAQEIIEMMQKDGLLEG